MGKNSKSGRKKKAKAASTTADSNSNTNSTDHGGSSALYAQQPSLYDRSNPQYPPPFPHSKKLSLPPNQSFVQNNGNYQKAYAKALETSYEGFVYDGPDAKSDDGSTIFAHDKIRNALQTMEAANIFRTDVTQPFGLGTKCAKTYVTRCLLGERGTTYKYLGLRMFSHPWDANDADISDKSLLDALRTIAQLNNTLTDRTVTHLSALDEKRRSKGVPQPTIKGRAKFDISLINRMVTSEDLKPEPMTSKGRCTVSWHADSCLEHYSTIGVYHTLFEDSANGNDDGGYKKKPAPDGSGWSVALRVAHDSEGPGAGSRGADIDVVAETPVISTSLPSGAAYYMLDDFNHHHQHAVLAPESPTGGVRFSSTHRLLRLGHNVSFVIERCRTTCAGFHKKGPKVWRSEQLLLTDTESEWIRQFYIQGSGHKANLWPYWKEPICALLKYWSMLEARTKQIIDLLRLAAEERCGVGASDDSSCTPSRSERKLREKRKKAEKAIVDIMGRNASSFQDACDALYEPMAELLEERAKMRTLWAERAKDKVFKRMDLEYKPLPAPFVFEESNEGKANEEEVGRSPLAEDLVDLATNLRLWGKAYRSKNAADLPKIDGSKESNGPKKQGGSDNHAKSLSWEGWGLSDKRYGLEMQDPWARALLSGEKKIETRAYDLPPALIGKQILILESKPGKAGVSSLGNVISAEDGIEKYVRVIGYAIFDRVAEYKDRDSFEKDEKLHLVTRDSGYGWKDGKTNVIYGWVCSSVTLYSAPEEEAAKVGALVRRMRSLYQIQPKRIGQGNDGSSPNRKKSKKKKKKRNNADGASSKIQQGMPKGGAVGQKKKKRRY